MERTVAVVVVDPDAGDVDDAGDRTRDETIASVRRQTVAPDEVRVSRHWGVVDPPLRTEWVVWLRTGDRLEPKWLAAVHRFLDSNPSIDLVVTNGTTGDGDDAAAFYDDERPFAVDHQREAILRAELVVGPAAARSASTNLAEPATSGWAMWVQVILDGAKVGLVDEALATGCAPAADDAAASIDLRLAHAAALSHPRLRASERQIIERWIADEREVSGSSSGRLRALRRRRPAIVEPPPVVDGGPVVSVVLSFFNEEEFLRGAYETVAAQTFSEWELLLVDDGSTDSSGAIATVLADGDARVTMLRHPGGLNNGLAASRNLGLAHARGRLLAYLDADDRWQPDKLERQVAMLDATPRAAMVCGPTWHRHSSDPGSGEVVPVVRKAPRVYRRGGFAGDLVCGGLIGSPPPSNVMYRTADLRASGGIPEGDSLYEDQRAFVALSLNGGVLVGDVPLSTYMVRDDSLYGSVKRDVETQLRQRRNFERWIVANAINLGGISGGVLIVRLFAHRARRGFSRRARALAARISARR